jgi:hypothetical protein
MIRMLRSTSILTLSLALGVSSSMTSAQVPLTTGAKKVGPKTTQMLLNRLAARTETPETLGRFMLQSAFRLAAKQSGKLADGQALRIKASVTGGGGMSGCFRTTICFEDEAAQQSICQEAEICGEFEGATSLD